MEMKERLHITLTKSEAETLGSILEVAARNEIYAYVREDAKKLLSAFHKQGIKTYVPMWIR